VKEGEKILKREVGGLATREEQRSQGEKGREFMQLISAFKKRIGTKDEGKRENRRKEREGGLKRGGRAAQLEKNGGDLILEVG